MVTTSRSRPAAARPSTTSTTSRCSPSRRRATATSSRCRRTRTSTASTTSRASTSSCSSSTTRASIATTGCLGGAVSQALLAGRLPARAASSSTASSRSSGATRSSSSCRTTACPSSCRSTRSSSGSRASMRAPLLATNDSHYTHRDDAEAHDALLCVQTGAMLDDPKRFKFDADEFYLKTAAEMRDLFADYEEACDNTLLIAERADVEIEFGNSVLPAFPTPAGSRRGLLPARAHASRARRTATAISPGPDVLERIEFELGVIKTMGFSAYFLVVWDLVRYARDARHPGRSRAGERGGLVRRVLPAHRRHRPDPVRPAVRALPQPGPQADARHRHGLRLPLPRRDDQVRGRALRLGPRRADHHVLHDQGAGRGARLGAGARLPVRGRRQDRQAHAAADHGPRHAAAGVLREGQRATRTATRWPSELRALYEADPDAKRVIDVARGLEGLRRQDGIHAAAVVITREPLTEYLPIQRKPEAGGDDRGRPDRHAVRDARRRGPRPPQDGLPRPAQPRRARDHARPRRADAPACRPDIDRVPLDDAKTFELLRARRHRSACSSSKAGRCARSCARWRRPRSRTSPRSSRCTGPGPMAQNWHNEYADRKNGRKPVDLPPRRPRGDPRAHLRADDLPGAADARRAAAGRLHARGGRQPPQGDGQEDPRADRQGAHRSSSRAASRRATTASSASGSSTSSSRSPTTRSTSRTRSGYGFVAYQTAYLKANHPVEYLAALLTSVKTNKDQTAVFLNECRQLGIAVLVPDVNESVSDFSVRDRPDGKAVRFGLSAVRNVGEGVVAQIVAAREEGGPFTDFYDFCDRVDPTVLNKRTDRVADQGGRVRLARPPAPGPAVRVRDRSSTPCSTVGATRPRASSTCSPRSTSPTPESVVGHRADRSPTPSSRSRSGSRSRRRCSGST